MFPSGQGLRWSIAERDLAPADRARLRAACRHRHFAPGTLVYATGDPGTSVFIVRSGGLRVFQASVTGEEFTLCILLDGQCTGLTSAMQGVARPVSVETIGPSELLELSRAELFRLMHDIPGFAVNVAVLLASLAQESIHSSTWFALQSATQRLCSALLALGGAADGDAAAPCVIRGVSQRHLASMVGVSRTWVSLTLARLADEGLLWRKRNEIGIRDPQLLAARCAALPEGATATAFGDPPRPGV